MSQRIEEIRDKLNREKRNHIKWGWFQIDDVEYLLAHVEKLTKALQKIGLNVDRINVREKTNIEEYCRESRPRCARRGGGMRHLYHQKNFTIMNG